MLIFVQPLNFVPIWKAPLKIWARVKKWSLWGATRAGVGFVSALKWPHQSWRGRLNTATPCRAFSWDAEPSCSCAPWSRTRILGDAEGSVLCLGHCPQPSELRYCLKHCLICLKCWSRTACSPGTLCLCHPPSAPVTASSLQPLSSGKNDGISL